MNIIFISILSIIFLYTPYTDIMADEKNQIKIEISNYLNKISSLEANFRQENIDKSTSNGKIYIQKPDKFKWDYTDQPIAIVSDGKSLIFHDKELDQTNYTSLKENIISIILEDNVLFSEYIEIENFSIIDKYVYFTLLKKNHNNLGKFTFIFSYEPIELKKIKILDNNQQEILVTLKNVKINKTKFPNKFFQIKDSRFK